MNVVFFEVDGTLNFPESEARAPDGSLGISDAYVKEFKKKLDAEQAKPVLCGTWAKEWNFEDNKCTAKGVYLNKKLDRRGIHILDKVDSDSSVEDWLTRHSNVEKYSVLKAGVSDG